MTGIDPVSDDTGPAPVVRPERGVVSVIPAAPRGVRAPSRTIADGLRLRLTRNLGWALGADAVARGISFGLSIFCARLLPVAGFGLFALTQSVAQYAWLLADGVANSAYATREVARTRGTDASSGAAMLSARILAGIGLAGLYLAAVFALPLASEKRTVLAAASVFFPAYAAFPDWLARGLENFRALAVAQVAMGLGLVAACALILPGHATPAVAVAIWGGSFLVGGVVLLALLARENGFRFRMLWPGTGRRERLSGSALFWLGGLGAMGITHVPTIVLGAIAPARELAQFSAGLRIIIACVGLGGVALWPFYSAMSAMSPDSPAFRQTLRDFLAGMLGASVCMAFVLWLFAAPLVLGLFGPGYADAVPTVRWLACTLPLYFLVSAFEITALATGAESLRARVNGIAVGLLVVVALALVPSMGARGAVIALSASLAVASAGYVVTLRNHLGAAGADRLRPPC